MHDLERWVIIDTETTGIRSPVYPVEIAAQVMEGWRSCGDPFRVLLNFDVPIEPAAQSLHGYSREYLRVHGIEPEAALSLFSEYAQGLPISAYNMPYDWSRVLRPVYEQRPGLRSPGVGFCALGLTRRVVHGLPNFKFGTVLRAFEIAEDTSHHADDDVALLVDLLSGHIGPHLRSHQVIGIDQVLHCAKGKLPIPRLEPSSGALSRGAPAPSSGLGRAPTLEMQVRLHDGSETTIDLDHHAIFAIGELVGICRTIVLDKTFTGDELTFLASWLEDCPYSAVRPIVDICDLVQKIIADEVVTRDEQQSLREAIDELCAWRPV